MRESEPLTSKNWQTRDRELIKEATRVMPEKVMALQREFLPEVPSAGFFLHPDGVDWLKDLEKMLTPIPHGQVEFHLLWRQIVVTLMVRKDHRFVIEYAPIWGAHFPSEHLQPGQTILGTLKRIMDRNHLTGTPTFRGLLIDKSGQVPQSCHCPLVFTLFPEELPKDCLYINGQINNPDRWSPEDQVLMYHAIYGFGHWIWQRKFAGRSDYRKQPIRNFYRGKKDEGASAPEEPTDSD